MKRIVVSLLILIMSISTMNAHNPLSALYYLEVNERISILTISLSQNGLNEALRKHFPEINLEDLSNSEYKELAVNYVKENFNLLINGHKIQLLEGGIKLGSHETGMKFITSALPKTFNKLHVNVKAFSENEQHQTVFSVLLNGITSKVILNQQNNYEASVIFSDNTMLVDFESFNKHYLWFLLIIPIFLIGKKLMAKTS